MNNTIKLSVDSDNKGKRLDIFYENINQFTRSFLKKLIEDKKVKLNSKVLLSPSTKVKYMDQITIYLTESTHKNISPQKIKLNIVYEDKDILIINKPKEWWFIPEQEIMIIL